LRQSAGGVVEFGWVGPALGDRLAENRLGGRVNVVLGGEDRCD